MGETVRTDFSSLRVRLTYADCDPAGIVYFAAWFPWMERMLSTWLHDQGLRSDKLQAEHGFSLLTRHTECEYLSPAELFDEIDLILDTARLGVSSVQWGFSMKRPADDVLVGRGKITWVTVDAAGRPRLMPTLLKGVITNFPGG